MLGGDERKNEGRREVGEVGEEEKGIFQGEGIKEVEEGRENGTLVFGKLEDKDREEQRKERWVRIMGLKFNKWYKRVKGKGVSGYLKKGWTEERWERIAKYRMGEGVREAMYWGKEKDRLGRVCGKEEETWKHVWEECGSWGTRGVWEERVEEVLEKEGKGENWIKR